MTGSEVDEISQETGRSVSRVMSAWMQLRYALTTRGGRDHNARTMILAQAAQVRELTAEKNRLLIEVAAAVEQQTGLAQKLEAARARHDEPEAGYATSEDYVRALNAGEAQLPLWQRIEHYSEMLAERGPYEDETAEQAAQVTEDIDRYRQSILDDAEQLPAGHRQMARIAVHEISWWAGVDEEATETEHADAQYTDTEALDYPAEIIEAPPDCADAPPIDGYVYEEPAGPANEVVYRPWQEPPQMEAES
ncbi:hypothetical protein ACIRRA_13480 [Nocardia sp. NPDC101769]|uniref:hypothetical protein n=1 Tax=Nocardia sp. NPDC101769 TaxID=3364333 RepID=UPI003828AB9F